MKPTLCFLTPPRARPMTSGLPYRNANQTRMNDPSKGTAPLLTEIMTPNVITDVQTLRANAQSKRPQIIPMALILAKEARSSEYAHTTHNAGKFLGPTANTNV